MLGVERKDLWWVLLIAFATALLVVAVLSWAGHGDGSGGKLPPYTTTTR